MEQAAYTLFGRLKEKASHCIVLAIVAKQLDRIFRNKIPANWLTVIRDVIHQQETDDSRHRRHQHAFKYAQIGLFDVGVAEFCQFNVDVIEYCPENTTDKAH
jgi:hypothetical protein